MLTRAIVEEVVDQYLAEPTRASAHTIRVLIEQGYTSDSPPDAMDLLITASCQTQNDELVELWLANPACDAFRHEFTFAALHPGRAKVLQWSREFGEKWEGMDTQDVATLAVSAGNVDMVDYLVHTHGILSILPPKCGVSETDCLTIVTVLYNAGVLPSSALPIHYAASNGHLQVLQYLHEHRKERLTAFSMAATNGHLHVVKWLHENRAEGSSSLALSAQGTSGCVRSPQEMGTHQPSLSWASRSIVATSRSSNGFFRRMQWQLLDVNG